MLCKAKECKWEEEEEEVVEEWIAQRERNGGRSSSVSIRLGQRAQFKVLGSVLSKRLRLELEYVKGSSGAMRIKEGTDYALLNKLATFQFLPPTQVHGGRGGGASGGSGRAAGRRLQRCAVLGRPLVTRAVPLLPTQPAPSPQPAPKRGAAQELAVPGKKKRRVKSQKAQGEQARPAGPQQPSAEAEAAAAAAAAAWQAADAAARLLFPEHGPFALLMAQRP